MNPVNPRRPGGTRTWLVPAVSARNTWGVPAVGGNPLPPATRSRPRPDAGSSDAGSASGSGPVDGPRTWRVPSTLDKVADTGGTPAVDARLEWHVPSSMARTTWRVPAVTGPTRVIGDDDWRATTPVTGRQRAVEGPEPGQDARATAARPAPATFPEGIASSSGGTRLTDAWRPAAPAPRPTTVQPDDRDEHDEPEAPAGEVGEVDPPAPGLEHGDRELFLALARQRLSQGIPVNRVHPAPAPPPGEAPGFAPEPGYTNLVDDDLIGTFARAVEEAGGVCHVVEGEIPDTLLDHIVAELGGWEAVVSAETEAVALGHSLAGRGVEVRQATPEAAARATLGLTSAIAGVAATGSIVLDSRLAGGRLASLLPPVH
ncbi:MAG TPA: LUD domain-containing protein, partial [Acidimicrobiales bacterium]|nr:LUD domain-containing protein [Acidimicrobiales bacterium]